MKSQHVVAWCELCLSTEASSPGRWKEKGEGRERKREREREREREMKHESGRCPGLSAEAGCGIEWHP